MRRLAALDIGSNTVHVLVADEEEGRLTEVGHHVEMPELGMEVQRTGKIGHRGRRRALQALRRVMKKAHDLGYEHLVAGATQAVREAADGEKLLAEASAALGVNGKLCLWRTLEMLAPSDRSEIGRRLSDFDFKRLIGRAERQLGRLEKQRLAASREAFKSGRRPRQKPAR